MPFFCKKQLFFVFFSKNFIGGGPKTLKITPPAPFRGRPLPPPPPPPLFAIFRDFGQNRGILNSSKKSKKSNLHKKCTFLHFLASEADGKNQQFHKNDGF
jgi:hypothetical protein